MLPKYVLITGCSAGGIGSALAVAFQKRGLSVFATGRDLSKLLHLAELANVTLLVLSPTSAESVQGAVEKVKAATGGKLDYLVNNAGQTVFMPTLDFDIELAKEMFDINVWGAVRVTQAFADLVIAAKGTVVNICSISTSVNTPWMGESLFLGKVHSLSTIFAFCLLTFMFVSFILAKSGPTQVSMQVPRQQRRLSRTPCAWKWLPLASKW